METVLSNKAGTLFYVYFGDKIRKKLLKKIRKQRHINAVHGEQRKDDADDNLRLSFPDAGIAFPVILAHDLFNVCDFGLDFVFFTHSRHSSKTDK